MKRDDIKKHLQTVPLFKELSDEELEPIISISSPRKYNAHSIIFMQDELLDRVFFIHTGTVKIYKTDANGKEQIVSVLKEGEMFPHAGFFRKGTFPANAEVIENAQLIVTPINDFEKILISYPELCIKMFRVLGEKIVDLQNRLEEKILHNTYEQVIMLLIRLAKSNGEKIGDSYKITTKFTNTELANMIGTSRETVSRTLTQLRKKAAISLDSKDFYIVNLSKLEEEINH
ncbi:Crp/Fnr family transcriptional regulator [Bacillus sp. AFS055030]|uniref:Crp/Fnr family transcriptional regulator n=1 Tax=Bacillus sp. AFS055030 TaxID=2033507 RepID=UPI000BFB87D7|nr:Crp/Fnr family transcriptional regulator [Bacillus sp. AFS055030]PGL72162.1 Crp/Fnr family transcriptional regulator [Bacillus sp. AFS055030]